MAANRRCRRRRPPPVMPLENFVLLKVEILPPLRLRRRKQRQRCQWPPLQANWRRQAAAGGALGPPPPAAEGEGSPPPGTAPADGDGGGGGKPVPPAAPATSGDALGEIRAADILSGGGAAGDTAPAAAACAAALTLSSPSRSCTAISYITHRYGTIWLANTDGVILAPFSC